ncbi:hypothetical protein M408DRAFT_64489 [Serendipita vermifera MAFF 305830]|uniref:Uncharacterized protein n=1 Tax=Serendipita vermifera MAFF 305830 TaxID=933852 RepID=A0A0C3B3D5_SERVB|nr:hypothetical protein M408DRAFT_64489 [Serendipita vermifera MAFF 305830]
MPIALTTLNAIRNAISGDITRHASIGPVLEHLADFESEDPKQIRHAWDANAYHLARLVRDGILDRGLVDSLANEVVSLTAIPKADLEDFKQTTGKFIDQMRGDSAVFSAGFTLRALAIHPKRVLPPGKSLISLFMNQLDETDEAERKQKKNVENILKKAYWDTALEQISSPSPEEQIPRIKVFYRDLFDALRPFINPNHPLMVALRSPLSPSPNPLASALNYLHSTLALMRTICAPIRDQVIEDAMKSIDVLDKLHAPREELATTYIDGMKFALGMGQTLVDDYQGVMSKFGDDSNVAALFRGSAREHERDSLLSSFGEEELKRSWREWHQSKPWTNKLVDIIGTLDPVMHSQDTLPPIVRINRLDVAEAQSLMLGLLIAASLRTLVPPLPAGRQTLLYRDDKEAIQAEAQFMERLWLIIGADPYYTDTTQQASVDNMASEVLCLYKQRHPDLPNMAAKEKEISDMVARMVDDEAHPVRVLLKKRLLDAFKERLSHPIVPLDHDLPSKVAAGRSVKPVARLKPGKVFIADQPEADLLIPGFTDPVLKTRLMQTLHLMRVIQGWVEYAWNDIYSA